MYDGLRVFGSRLRETALTLGNHRPATAVADIGRHKHRDLPVAALIVVSPEEGPATAG